MLANVSKKVELIANAAIIVVSCLLASALVRNHLRDKSVLNQPPQPQQAQPAIGPSISALAIDWKKEQQTLILAISSSCHFCTDSAPFYRRIVKSKGNTQIVAVLPQSVAEGREYLDSLGIPVDEVIQSDLDKISVRGTPTLLLTDNAGNVKQSWLGRLSTADESKVLAFLH